MKFLLTALLFMSYLNMNARVTIGDESKGTVIVVKAIKEFDIEESIEQTSDKATIVLARNYKEIANKPILAYIRSGMPVKIECGYNGDLQTEFTGFIKPNGIDARYPIVLECDELQDFRQTNWVASWRSITLKELLTKVAPGYSIECPDVNLGRIQLKNASTWKVLDDIKKNWGFFSSIRNKTLHVGFSYDYSPSFTKEHDFTFGLNIRDNKKLQFVTEDDFNVQLKVVIHQANGKRLEITKGSTDKDASVKKYDAAPMDKGTADKIAEAQLKKVVYTGFKGSFEGFCEPRVHAGDTVRLINRQQPDQAGSYLVEKIKLSYKESKIVREIFPSIKIA